VAYERSLDKKEIKLSALKRSKYKILLVDKTKFSTDGTHKIASLDELDFVITD
jgi:DeoR/GlpR family transcriptional regulator of sugar metabolism